jgi:hypothetical protein
MKGIWIYSKTNLNASEECFRGAFCGKSFARSLQNEENYQRNLEDMVKLMEPIAPISLASCSPQYAESRDTMEKYGWSPVLDLWTTLKVSRTSEGFLSWNLELL